MADVGEAARLAEGGAAASSGAASADAIGRGTVGRDTIGRDAIGRHVKVRVRYFAGAKAAAGIGEELRHVADGCSIAGLLDEAGFGAVPVFVRSTFLLNGVTMTDRTQPLHDGDTLDVLPPFAGG